MTTRSEGLADDKCVTLCKTAQNLTNRRPLQNEDGVTGRGSRTELLGHWNFLSDVKASESVGKSKPLLGCQQTATAAH
jgi:hypothetical protein